MRLASLIALTLLALAAPAHAIDFTVVLQDLDGQPMQNGGKAMTLGDTVAHALLSPYAGEESIAGEEKIRRFELARKLRGAVDPALTAEDVALIKKLVAKAFAPLVVGRVWEIVDPASVKAR
ncbi:MAG: hypothetical protein IT481_08630 [Gammaproteobacteria bacterium]|nr:hypothetical protein [Gammaproteobacteria bacterium]